MEKERGKSLSYFCQFRALYARILLSFLVIHQCRLRGFHTLMILGFILPTSATTVHAKGGYGYCGAISLLFFCSSYLVQSISSLLQVSLLFLRFLFELQRLSNVLVGNRCSKKKTLIYQFFLICLVLLESFKRNDHLSLDSCRKVDELSIIRFMKFLKSTPQFQDSPAQFRR